MSGRVIRMICPNLQCRKVLAVPITACGKTVHCRNCGMRVQVPDQVAASEGARQSSAPSPEAPPAS